MRLLRRSVPRPNPMSSAPLVRSAIGIPILSAKGSKFTYLKKRPLCVYIKPQTGCHYKGKSCQKLPIEVPRVYVNSNHPNLATHLRS